MCAYTGRISNKWIVYFFSILFYFIPCLDAKDMWTEASKQIEGIIEMFIMYANLQDMQCIHCPE